MAFFDVWGKAWLDSERERLSRRVSERGQTTASRRLPYLHCHSRLANLVNEQSRPLREGYAAIGSAFTAFSVCPTWPLGAEGDLPDESRETDAGIAPSRRGAVALARAGLIEGFARAATRFPGDEFFVGQHVRLLIDQALPDSALSAARACRSETWWCGVLSGYVHHHRGEIGLAESAFTAARASMGAELRCEWEDLGPLLSDEEQALYRGASCAERSAMGARYWWLSDPLYDEPGNERLVAHDARSVLLTLRAAFPVDGRVRWSQRYGSDAMARMVMRYGWPSGVAWGGPMEDANHSVWMRQASSPEQPPYTTFEYSRARVHTTPHWWAVERPFLAADSAWDLRAPSARATSGPVWWPIEHVARSRRLVPMPGGQTALLRRDHDILVAAAHDFDAPLRAMLGDTREAVMLTSNGPGHVARVDVRRALPENTLVLRGRMPDQPAILGVEMRSVSPSGVDARTRTGLTPPAALQAMQAGDLAISEPLLLRPLESEATLARGDSVVELMLGSTRWRRGVHSRVGVYWESYGFREDDSVTVSVRIERQEKVGFFRRLGAALTFSDIPNSSLGISWREPDRLHGARRLKGAVPAIARALVLDLSQLSTGQYDLVLSMTKSGSPPVQSRRRFTIAE
ncbi:MAG TPA: hypothetical protein VE869_18395 [Gemmatimonas sp.]|nr:hypothetical protein [Gemmatimonas sp.]